MTLLSNLLLYQHGYSGFSSYVRRVMPAIPGWRLVLDPLQGPLCRLDDELPMRAPASRRQQWMLRLSLAQHALSVPAALARSEISHQDISCLYSPYCDYLFSLPMCPQVITCHDLTPLHFSNSSKAFWRYKLWTPRHLERATKVIAISNFVASQLVDIGVPAGKIEVVHNGVVIERRAIERPASFDFIMLARHDYNKNVAFVIQAFMRLLERRPDWPGKLTVVGRQGRQSRELLQLASSPTLDGRVQLIEALSPESMLEKLRSSLALISASLMEGFDYPVLEAMAEGLPTLISSIPVHQELYAESSRFFDLDPAREDLTSAMLELGAGTDLWTQISTAGLTRAREYSLERQQNAILQVLQST